MRPPLPSRPTLTVLGSRIRDRRACLGLSQEAFAGRCGFDRTYISMIERGKRNISILNLLRIARGLNVSASTLLDGIDDGPDPKQ
ncbi:MAG: helix-turn-helix transcriptional regulator [Acidobacteriota bacterium]|nr:helix-turn-helix transcriptional regulator [Acidobacteriota bacterium]